MEKYTPANNEIAPIVEDLVNSVPTFFYLQDAKIECVFDNRDKGKAIGRVVKPNNLIDYFTGGEVNYVLIVRKIFWELTEKTPQDRIRLVRHELQHCQYNPEKDDNWELKDHEVTDFYEEIENNVDDPRWCERVSHSIASEIERRKEEKKLNKKDGNRNVSGK